MGFSLECDIVVRKRPFFGLKGIVSSDGYFYTINFKLVGIFCWELDGFQNKVFCLLL
jgi:hypothetical protein